MTIAFFSNFLNHHQVPVADELYNLTEGNYFFIEIISMPDSFKHGGYSEYNDKPYLIQAWKDQKSQDYAFELARTVDVAIMGGPESLCYLRERLSYGLLTFIYSERLFKKGVINILSPHLLKFLLYYYWGFRTKSLYLLCASSFASSDFNMLGMFRDKCYKWGYFTDVQNNVSERSIGIIPSAKIRLMWCARFLKWKHPELAVKLAVRLKRKGVSFILDMYGSGEYLDSTKGLAIKLGVDDCINFKGNFPNVQILKAMDEHDVFLFTSDQHEGWGAVANEAMSRGCVLIGSNKIGSVPYLVKDGVNGLVFESENLDSLEEKTMFLIRHPNDMIKIANNGIMSMKEIWSPSIAAKNFVILANNLISNKQDSTIEGPCSIAK